jgi:hypothetical protein
MRSSAEQIPAGQRPQTDLRHLLPQIYEWSSHYNNLTVPFLSYFEYEPLKNILPNVRCEGAASFYYTGIRKIWYQRWNTLFYSIIVGEPERK